MQLAISRTDIAGAPLMDKGNLVLYGQDLRTRKTYSVPVTHQKGTPYRVKIEVTGNGLRVHNFAIR